MFIASVNAEGGVTIAEGTLALSLNLRLKKTGAKTRCVDVEDRSLPRLQYPIAICGAYRYLVY